MLKIKILLLCLSLCLILLTDDSKAQSGLETLIQEADALFTRDYIKSDLRESIALYEKALELDPNNRYVLNRLAEAYYKLGYVHLFVLAEDPDVTSKERIETVEKGLGYGMRSLDLNPLFKAKKGRDFGKAIQEIDDVAALHWLSCNWGNILESNFLRAFFELPKLQAVLERALEIDIDKEYLYGGTLRAMATYWASLPSWYGQDLKKAKFLFEESIALYPEFLGNRALYIQKYLAQPQIKNCPAIKEQAYFIKEISEHEEYRIWDIAAKKGIEKFLKTIDWCSLES